MLKTIRRPMHGVFKFTTEINKMSILSDDAIFIFSRLFYFIIQPDIWVVLGLFFTAFFICTDKQRLAKYISVITFVSTMILGIVPLGFYMCKSLETSFPISPQLDKVDGIIILGGAEDPIGTANWGQVQLNGAAERFTEGLYLARRYPNAKILFSGGSNQIFHSHNPEYSGASVAEKFFSNFDIPSNRIILEPKSRNTSENARFSYASVKPRDDEVWVLITSAFHMPRAMQSFKSAGWKNLIAYPVDFNGERNFLDAFHWNLSGNLAGLGVIIKEYVGGMAYNYFNR